MIGRFCNEKDLSSLEKISGEFIFNILTLIPQYHLDNFCRLLYSPRERQKIGISSKSFFASTWDNQAENIAQIYKELVTKGILPLPQEYLEE